MKKIVTAFLCALLLLALPVMAAQPDAPPSVAIAVPAAHALPVTAEVATDLKLQQQKLEFFKERLQMQDERIGDLGLMIGFFGALITITVVFFSIRSKSEAVGAARDEAQEEIKKRAKEYIEADLRPAVDKALKDIQVVADKRLEDLRKAHEVTQELNARHKGLIEGYSPIISRDNDKPGTPEQKPGAEETAKKTQSVLSKEYHFSDQLALGIQAYEQGKYERAAEHFDKAASIAESLMDRALALANKGGALGLLQRNEEAIVIFDEVVKDYGEASEVTLRVHVASALINKGVVLSQLQWSEKAIAVYDEVVKRYGEAPEEALRVAVAKALVNKGVQLGQLQQNEKAITVYDEVVKRYGEAPEEALRVAVGKALVNQGVQLGQLQQNEKAITVYDEVVKRYGEAPEVALRVRVASALINKGIALSELQHFEKEIAVYEEVVKRYGEAPEAALRVQVASALINKGVVLSQLQRNKEAIAVCDEVVKRYSNAPESALREAVATARTLKKRIQSEQPS
jgi:tetratricopeptide (TPR) repeat protein